MYTKKCTCRGEHDDHPTYLGVPDLQKKTISPIGSLLVQSAKAISAITAAPFASPSVSSAPQRKAEPPSRWNDPAWGGGERNSGTRTNQNLDLTVNKHTST